MDPKDNSNEENRRLDSKMKVEDYKMKVEDLNNERSEMRVPQDLKGLAALSLFDQNRN